MSIALKIWLALIFLYVIYAAGVNNGFMKGYRQAMKESDPKSKFPRFPKAKR